MGLDNTLVWQKLLAPITRVPQSVWVGSGVRVPTLPSPPTWQAPIDPLKHPNHH